MRVVIAIDGSDGSRDAARLVGGMAWPSDTQIDLVSVVDPGAWIAPAPGVPGTGGLLDEREITAYLQGHQTALADLFSDRPVETRILRGRPSDAIVDEAARVGADVIVMGSRGHGTIATLLLGSVSAGVVDRAACPVLVARRTTLSRVVVAVDGSSACDGAVGVVASWPAFAKVPIVVVGVAEAVRPWTLGVAPAFQVHAHETYAADSENAMREAQEVVEKAAAILHSAHRATDSEVRSGEVAAEVIAGAAGRSADLIVLGTRGRTGLTGILLGSVARNVLLGTDASVLVARASPEP